jgi:hypothetical protein
MEIRLHTKTLTWSEPHFLPKVSLDKYSDGLLFQMAVLSLLPGTDETVIKPIKQTEKINRLVAGKMQEKQKKKNQGSEKSNIKRERRRRRRRRAWVCGVLKTVRKCESDYNFLRL